MSGHPLLDREAQPPSSSSTSSSSDLALPWPFSDLNLIFYIDPYSQGAQDFKEKLQDQATANSLVFPFTLSIDLASHILLDPACEESAPLRSVALPQRVVALAWLEDSIEAEEALPEKDYAVSRGAAAARSTAPRRRSNFGESWTSEEEEEMARFLASSLKPGQPMLPIWRLYQKAHPSRTVSSYIGNYNFRRQTYFEPKIAELRAALSGQPIAHKQPKEIDPAREDRLARRTRLSPNQPMPSTDPLLVPVARRTRKKTKPLRHGKCFNCEVDESAFFGRIQGKGDKTFCKRCYQIAYTANTMKVGTGDNALAAHRAKVLGPQGGEAVVSPDLSTSRDASYIDDPRASRARKRAQASAAGSNKRTRLDFSPAPHNAVASSSSSSSSSDPHLLVQPNSQPVASGSKSLPSQALAPEVAPAQPRPHLPVASPPHGCPLPRPITRDIASPSPTITSSTASSSHHLHPHRPSPPPVASGSNPSPNRRPPSPAANAALPPPPPLAAHPQLPPHPRLPSSPPPEPLEPPSFLILGTKPSNSSASSDAFCFFCGSATQPPFTFLTLASKSLEDPSVVIGVPARLACWVCTRVYQTRVVDGKRLGEGVKEMGGLERLGWVTEVLVEKGIEERRRRVEG